MADIFEDHPMLVNERRKLWDLINATPNLDWLLLTKRPENIPLMMPWRVTGWPNVWLGTSTEDQERADLRIPILLERRNQVPILFLSVEPQLGPVTLEPWLDNIDWVIVGGESGPGHRPFSLDWARALRNQCLEAGVAFHFKQVGGFHHAAGGRLLDGRTWDEFPTPRLPEFAGWL